MEKKVVLSIAGSDSSGGAGIQADLKSFSYLGLHGVTAVTCVTAQNTKQVRSIYRVPPDMIRQQIESLCDDFSIAGVKTGMLYDEEIIAVVAEQVKKQNFRPVVDPVMVATSGDALSSQGFVATLKTKLLPSAFMVTANSPEAGILAERKMLSLDDCEKAAKDIFELGSQYVLVKGGHLKGKMVTDLLYDGKQMHRFTLPRVPQRKAHGSGCTLSALITGLLAVGEPPVSAVHKAKSIVWGMINEGYAPGKGADVLNHSPLIHIPPVIQNKECFDVWLQLKNAVESLLDFLPSQLIPEVGMNFVYALPNPKTRDDVCAIDGRITERKAGPALCGSLEFGCSKHVASIILTATSINPTIRAALNIRYSPEIVDLCRKIGLSVGSFDRKFEPPDAPSTMEWGTKHVITSCGFVPDVIYDSGSVGKEPMIRMIGTDPQGVLKKIKTLIQAKTL